MNGEHAAAATADLIKKIQDWVREDMKADDHSGEDLIEMLDLAWCAAERWRIEQFDLLRDEEAPPSDGSVEPAAFNA